MNNLNYCLYDEAILVSAAVTAFFWTGLGYFARSVEVSSSYRVSLYCVSCLNPNMVNQQLATGTNTLKAVFCMLPYIHTC